MTQSLERLKKKESYRMIYQSYVSSLKRKELSQHLDEVIDIWFTFNRDKPSKQQIDALKETIKLTVRDFNKWDIYEG